MIYKFTAKWCSSCLITNQNFRKLIQDYKSHEVEISYQEIDMDSTEQTDLELMKKFEIDENSVLPIIVFTDQNGVETTRSSGEKNRSELINLIDKDLIETQNKASPSNMFDKPNTGFLSNLKNIFK